MTNCKYKKILQFYLDGSDDRHDFKELEEHLRSCAECQLELAELEELNGAALEIADQAPERDYWESFPTRVRNRIIARNIVPVPSRRRLPWYYSLRMASVLVASVLLIGSAYILISGQLTTEGSNIGNVTGASKAVERTVESAGEPAILEAEVDLRQEGQENSIPPNAAVAVRGEALGPAPNIQRNNGAQELVEIKDLQLRFREVAIAGRGIPRLETEIKSYSSIYSTSFADIDPSFQMKVSLVNQRLLAGLNKRSQAGISGINQSATYGPGSVLLEGNMALSNESPSTWGYTSIPSDTSHSEEMKKYFLELELMEAK
jgi:hypothetical protein